jgi:hypothetical protein
MKYRAGQKVTITNQTLKCTPYNEHNGKQVKIEGKNTFLGLYEVTLGEQKWAFREEGLKIEEERQ